jgi:hypothetical protein
MFSPCASRNYYGVEAIPPEKKIAARELCTGSGQHFLDCLDNTPRSEAVGLE